MTHFLFKSHLRLDAQTLRTFIRNVTTSFNSISASSQQSNNQTLNFLINTLGLSQDSALTASKHIHIKQTTNPNSVLSLFNLYGFTPSHTANIFYRNPKLLLADPDTILQPKLEFLSRNGISGQVLADVICKDPSILRRSLEKQIVPCIEFLKGFFGDTKGIVSLFYARRGTWLLHKFTDFVAPNVELLRVIGVPDCNIGKMILVRPRTLSRDTKEFKEIVEEIREMGFDPKSLMFIHGVCALTGMKKDKWVSKFCIFKSFGWSEEEFLSLFVKQPKFMSTSEVKIKRALDFFSVKFGWTVEEISKYPIVLFLSFEKRVIPRSSILLHLISKGFIKKTSVGKAFMMREDVFLVKFVMEHLEKDPHLLEMYEKKTAIV